MNKKVIRLTIILTSLLVVMFIVQPKLAEVTADDRLLLAFDQLSPSGNVYQGDTVIFGGTVFNNQTRDLRLIELSADVYVPDNLSLPFHYYTHSLREQITRNILEPNEARTLSFEVTIGDELPKAENYTVILSLQFMQADQSEDDITPYTYQIGTNATIHILIPRDDAPKYIYAVFVLLLLGIIAFIVLGIVGWVRERRSS
ncbi:MAG: hypothetical protein HZR80_01430 [Candidatus Heimdallarchaeota archaeon]